MKVDSHLHTIDFSADAKMTRDELTDFLLDKPELLVSLTEHYDYDHPRPENALIFDPEANYKDYLQRKKKFEEEHKIPFPATYGVEMNYFPHLNGYLNEFVNKTPYDNVIASIHILDGKDIYFDRDYYDRGKEKSYAGYFEDLINMLENFQNFNILGHFDYVARYTPFDDPRIFYKDFKKYFDKIFSLLIKNEKTLELNVGTPAYLRRFGFKDFMPDPEIFISYKKAGGRLISYGSDAHLLNQILYLYDESISYFKSLGFSEIFYYKNRVPHSYKI